MSGGGWKERNPRRNGKKECKRPKGAAALHNQIPRRCSRMRSTPMPSRAGGGCRLGGESRGHAKTPKNALRPFCCCLWAGHKGFPRATASHPSRNSGNKPETPTRFVRVPVNSRLGRVDSRGVRPPPDRNGASGLTARNFSRITAAAWHSRVSMLVATRGLGFAAREREVATWGCMHAGMEFRFVGGLCRGIVMVLI